MLIDNFKSVLTSTALTPSMNRYLEVVSALLFGYIVFFIEVTCAYIVYRMVVSEII
jgi:hypothetical protein